MGGVIGQCERCGGSVRPEHVCPQDIATDFVIPIVPFRGDPEAGRDIVGIDRAEFDRRLAALIEPLRAENARLRALVDERTALLRECATSRAVLIAYVIDITDGEVPEKTHDLSRRIRAALETTCDS